MQASMPQLQLKTIIEWGLVQSTEKKVSVDMDGSLLYTPR